MAKAYVIRLPEWAESMPDHALIPLKDLAKAMGAPKADLYYRIKQGEFPKPDVQRAPKSSRGRLEYLWSKGVIIKAMGGDFQHPPASLIPGELAQLEAKRKPKKAAPPKPEKPPKPPKVRKPLKCETRYPFELVQTCRRLHEVHGISMMEIATQMGVKYMTVRQWCEYYNRRSR